MLLPAEIESRTLIPALRAILSKRLSEKYNIHEDEISKMLGVTQAAVSNYIRGTRGDPKLNNAEATTRKMSGTQETRRQMQFDTNALRVK